LAKIRFLTDEDFNRPILHGVRLRLPNLDIVRVQDVGLRSFRDERILEFAAFDDRIVLSHDVTTMKGHAEDRLRQRKPMPGLFLVRQDVPIGHAIEEIVIVAECSEKEEWNGEIRFLPL
jgi:predicted nuclease of predicted toxin-antitoxin system